MSHTPPASCPPTTEEHTDQHVSYHEHTDHKYVSNIRAGVPEAFDAFMEWDAQAMRNADNAIPLKYTELITMAGP